MEPSPSTFRIDLADPTALQEWVYLRFHEALLRFVRDSLGVGQADAEDLTQELYLRVPKLLTDWDAWATGWPCDLRKGGIWTPDECRVFGRLSGCVRRLTANMRRRRDRRQVIRERWSTRDSGRIRNVHGMRRTEARLDVEHVLDLLPARHALLLRLRFLDDLPHAVIAEAMDITEGAARLRLYRALNRARETHGNGHFAHLSRESRRAG